ncbi:MAG: hypothetical protein GX784_05085 [Firmicutes bacterium]|nr:hypothetical protein [Candidatus Fermentithermobacillaceae bacterium]
MKQWGIALGAGGILGFAHIGVLEALESRGLRPGFVAGTSAGAIVGGLWASGVKLSQVKCEMESLVLHEPVRILPDGFRGSHYHVPTTAIHGLLGTGWMESVLSRLTGNKNISEVDIPLAMVSCDLHTGDTVVLTNRRPGFVAQEGLQTHPVGSRRYVTNVPLAAAMVASSALPGVFVPKRLHGNNLVDGGVKEMVPAYEVRRLGAEEVLAVDLGWYIGRPRDVQGIYSVLSRSFNLATRPATLEHLKRYSSLTLTPPVWEPGLPTPFKIRSLVETGRRCAEKHLKQWLGIIG